MMNIMVSGLRLPANGCPIAVSHQGKIVPAGDASRRGGGLGRRRVSRVGASDMSRTHMGVQQSRDFIKDHITRYLGTHDFLSRLQKVRQQSPHLRKDARRIERDYHSVMRDVERFHSRQRRPITSKEMRRVTQRVADVAARGKRLHLLSHHAQHGTLSSPVPSFRHKDVLYDEMTFDKEKGAFRVRRGSLFSRGVKALALKIGVGREHYAQKAARAFAHAMAEKCQRSDVAHTAFQEQGHNMVALLAGQLVDTRGHYRPLLRSEAVAAAHRTEHGALLKSHGQWVQKTTSSLMPGGALWESTLKKAGLKDASFLKHIHGAWLRDSLEVAVRSAFHEPNIQTTQAQLVDVAAGVVRSFATMPPSALKASYQARLRTVAQLRDVAHSMVTGRMARVVQSMKKFHSAYIDMLSRDPAFGSPPQGPHGETKELSSDERTALLRSLMRPLGRQLSVPYAERALQQLQGDVGATLSVALGLLTEDTERSVGLEMPEEQGTSRAESPEEDASYRHMLDRGQFYYQQGDMLAKIEETLIEACLDNDYYPPQGVERARLFDYGREVRQDTVDNVTVVDPLGSVAIMRTRIEQDSPTHVDGEEVAAAIALYGGLWRSQLQAVERA